MLSALRRIILAVLAICIFIQISKNIMLIEKNKRYKKISWLGYTRILYLITLKNSYVAFDFGTNTTFLLQNQCLLVYIAQSMVDNVN